MQRKLNEIPKSLTAFADTSTIILKSEDFISALGISQMKLKCFHNLQKFVCSQKDTSVQHIYMSQEVEICYVLLNITVISSV